MKRQVITIATGKKFYVDLAVNLYHSFIYHNRNNDIDFYIVTDQKQYFSPITMDKLNIIEIKPNEFGSAFSPKLHLDKVAPTGQTLFIDSDCLIFGDLNSVFEKFKGKIVSVIGLYINNGEWFGDIKKICQKFEVKEMPKFNGGIYYLENGEIAKEVYQLARKLEENYDEIGFVRLRNKPNDEMLMSLSLAIKKQMIVLEDGEIMGDLFSCPLNMKSDILAGKTLLLNPPFPHPLHRIWFPKEEISPVIVHYLDVFTSTYQYLIAINSLKIALTRSFNLRDHIMLKLKYQIPQIGKKIIKDKLRPIYHFLFGFRKITQSERIS